MNLVTHSSVTIDRPASAIWPQILDPTEWKHGAKLWHNGGPVGQVGEVFAAGDPADKTKVAFLVENVELVANQRRTIKTVVTYDVYSETLIDPAQAKSMTVAQVLEAERTAFLANQKRFDEELRELKRLVEARR